MKKILFSILFLWICTTAFGQSMSWDFLASKPGVKFVDDTKLTYESADGVLKIEYELISTNGDNILYYDIQISPLPGDPITYLNSWGYSEGSISGPPIITWFWDNYYGDPLSGSVILDQGDPEDFNLAVQLETFSENYDFGFFATYYPN